MIVIKIDERVIAEWCVIILVNLFFTIFGYEMTMYYLYNKYGEISFLSSVVILTLWIMAGILLTLKILYWLFGEDEDKKEESFGGKVCLTMELDSAQDS